ncbi:MAG: YihA family ribosome biogenesis GTP-binding protein [Verrucomicrobia bacterium]|nr:YihA family ribosome biogenesis GTP-binding protein [Verrucomicrobiota bacterium]
MHISSAIFDRSAPDLNSCPDESLPEVAFIGRSNVGKSSLLNMLAGKRGLARVSPTPGFTKLINFFTMNRTWRLVDLPGYGYAHVARKDMAQFNQAVAEYLQHRPNLCCVFALIDSGLSPQKIDLEFVEWLAINAVPFVLVFTKTDKAKPMKVRTNIEAFKERFSEQCGNVPEIFTCSATTNEGRGKLLGVIEEALGGNQIEGQAEPEPPSQNAVLPAEDSPGTGWRIGAFANHGKRPNSARPW